MQAVREIVPKKELSQTMDGATSRGLATVRRIKRERNIEGAYGTLAELLEVDETYRTAVEQTAGSSLFHYVVDNADTATELADALYKQKGGRVDIHAARPASSSTS